MISKDLSWLWRTAYNCAVEGATEWTTDLVAEAFTLTAEVCLPFYATGVGELTSRVSLQLIVFMKRLSVGELDNELPQYHILALLAALTARSTRLFLQGMLLQ